MVSKQGFGHAALGVDKIHYTSHYLNLLHNEEFELTLVLYESKIRKHLRENETHDIYIYICIYIYIYIYIYS